MKKNIHFILALIFITVIVFYKLSTYEFTTWDDNQWIYENPDLKNPTFQSLTKYWHESFIGLYVPVTFTSWWIAAKVNFLFADSTNLNPNLFHTINILIHILSVVILYLILKFLLKNEFGALAGAVLFSIHPFQVEPVAWASGLKDILGGLFSLISIWHFLKYAQKILQEGAKEYLNRNSIICAITFLLAILSKPNSVITPLISIALLVFVYYYTDTKEKTTEHKQNYIFLLKFNSFLLILTLPFILANLFAQNPLIKYTPSLAERFLIAGDAVTFYIYKLLLPLSMCIDYGRLPEIVLQKSWIFFTGIAPYLLLAPLYLIRNRYQWLVVSVGIFFIGIIPILGFIPFSFQYISTVADHYLYLSLLGPAIIISWLTANYKNNMVVKIILLIVLCLLGIKSMLQVRNWENSQALYENTIKVNPQSFTSYNNLGKYFEIKGDVDRSIKEYSKALEVKPDYPVALNNIAIVLAKKGLLIEAEEKCQKAIELKPGYVKAYNTLGIIYTMKGEYLKAEEQFHNALRIDPNDHNTIRNLRILERKYLNKEGIK